MSAPGSNPPLAGSLMRQLALGLADGQLEQADRLLCDPYGTSRGYLSAARSARVSNLERALLHMRTACRWLQSGARA